MPILVKSLLSYYNIIDSKKGQDENSWRRVADLALFYSTEKLEIDPVPPLSLSDVFSSNVPLSESVLAQQDAALLPPSLNEEKAKGELKNYSGKEVTDPLPYIRICSGIIIFALLVEFLGGAVTTIFGKLRNYRELILVGLLWWSPDNAQAKVELTLIAESATSVSFRKLAEQVQKRTSIELFDNARRYPDIDERVLRSPWVWADKPESLTTGDGVLLPQLELWIKRGGFLVIEHPLGVENLKILTKKIRLDKEEDRGWMAVPPDHELMRSFYLLDALPACNGRVWQGFHFDGRLAILVPPYDFSRSLADVPVLPPCKEKFSLEQNTRSFVNVLMVALATDYKKDQIHLPEILKRLR
jgi:hypothetical protein